VEQAPDQAQPAVFAVKHAVQTVGHDDV